MTSSENIAECVVIGAGPAGLSAARTLTGLGRSIVVLDKGRGPGGRLSSRRTDETRFDHGCKELTFRDPETASALRSWIDAGVVSAWHPNMKDGSGSEPRFVGTPAMNDVIKHLARDLDVRFNTRIVELRPCEIGWEIIQQNGEIEALCRTVIVAIPAPQALDLLRPIGFDGVQRIEKVRLSGVWSVLLEGPHPDVVGFEAVSEPVPELAWLAAQAGKPGRTSDGAWVAHASEAWSNQHLEDDKHSVAETLGAICADALGVERLDSVIAHRWRFGLTSTPLGVPTLLEPDTGVAVAGDWCLGPTIEDALESGTAAARAIEDLLTT